MQKRELYLKYFLKNQSLKNPANWLVESNLAYNLRIGFFPDI